MAPESEGEASPQLRRERVEQHRAGIVVAVRAQRFAEPGIVGAVPLGARLESPVRAAAKTAARATGADFAVLRPSYVDRPEGRRGQRGEHRRVAGDGIGHALAADQARAYELVRVGAVDLGA
ncbi:hypothetical protein GCM10027176_31340 [Actinoallomurus bryophytorum]